MTNILVLGGTRFFGKRLVEKLINQGYSVTIATRGRQRDSFGDRVQRLIIDRNDPETLMRAFQHRNWDIVFDQSCYTPQHARDTIMALDGKTGRYLFTSSQAVYEYGTNHKEASFNPQYFNFTYRDSSHYHGYLGYQEGKKASEQLLTNWSGVQTVLIRYPIVIGRGDHTCRLKEHVEKISKGEPLGVVDARRRYSFITAEEASEFSLKIATTNFTGPINPGCEKDVSIGELIGMIEKQTGKKRVIPASCTPDNQSPYELEGSCSVNTDLAKQLGFTFSQVEACFSELISYYKKEIT